MDARDGVRENCEGVRENDEREDVVEGVDWRLLLEVEPSSISIRMESPWGEDDEGVVEGAGVASILALELGTFSGLLLLLDAFSTIMRRMDTVESDLDSSNDGMCFIFNEPRDEQDSTSS